MDSMTLLKQGAEARLYEGLYLGKPTIAKERFAKKYRHAELDSVLTAERIKAEARAIIRCRIIGIDVPTLYAVDFKRSVIFMEHFRCSVTAKEFIGSAKDALVERLAQDVGAKLAQMHSNGIVHGDLTTSNLLLVNKKCQPVYYASYDDLRLVFIDFGLAHINANAEDKGVDLYVLQRALLSTHSIAEEIFPVILNAYKASCKKGSQEAIVKFEEVQMRGRKRTMVG